MRQINLMPKALQEAEQKRFLIASLVVVLGPLAVVLALVHGVMQSRLSTLQRLAEDPLALSSSPEIVEMSRQIQTLKEETRRFVGDRQAVLELISRQALAPQVLTLTANAVTDRIWLQNLELDYLKNVLLVNGRSTETRQVSAYILELKRLPYFKSVELVTMGKDAAPGQEEIDFKIQCALK